MADYRARISPVEDDQKPFDLTEVVQNAVAIGDEALARAAWCLQRVSEIQQLYLKAFAELKSGLFYTAWCTLERCEIVLHSLDRHYADDGDHFGLAFITDHVERFQSLYPYKFFISPALLIKEALCSICGSRMTPHNPCHNVGELYWGVECLRQISSVDVLEMSIVTNPVQKYSVLFTGKEPLKDHYDYSSVRYVVGGLASPWHRWTYERTTMRHPHERYSHLGRNDPCPCESGKKYKTCCLGESGVLRPHIQFTFDEEPPPTLLPIEYSASR